MVARLFHLRAGAPYGVAVRLIVAHYETGNQASLFLQNVLRIIEWGSDEK